jgi:hypothetical protein
MVNKILLLISRLAARVVPCIEEYRRMTPETTVIRVVTRNTLSNAGLAADTRIDVENPAVITSSEMMMPSSQDPRQSKPLISLHSPSTPSSRTTSFAIRVKNSGGPRYTATPHGRSPCFTQYFSPNSQLPSVMFLIVARSVMSSLWVAGVWKVTTRSPTFRRPGRARHLLAYHCQASEEGS